MLRMCAAIALAVAAVGCGGTASRGDGGPPSTTPVAIASITATQSGGIAGGTRSLEVGPSDPRLGQAAGLVSIPLPASADTREPGCADCFDNEITVVLTDGSSATWRFQNDQAPDGVRELARWVAAQPMAS